jgi:DNA ligase (NAD+)
LYHFVSRPAMDIAGLGPSTIDTLIEEKLVMQPADLFRLQAKDLIGLPLLAEKKSANLIVGIADRRRAPLDRFIFSLGIRHVGQETARTLATHFGSLEKIMDAKQEELQRTEDIGGVVATSIAEFFSDAAHRRQVEELLKYVTITNPKKSATGKLQGKSVVVTGALETMSREEAEEKIRQAGGKAGKSVSAKTSYVLVGADPGSKAAAAEKLNVPILNEQQFLKLIG